MDSLLVKVALNKMVALAKEVRKFAAWNEATQHADVTQMKAALMPVLEANDRLREAYDDLAVSRWGAIWSEDESK